MAVERRATMFESARKKNATDAAVTMLAEIIESIERWVESSGTPRHRAIAYAGMLKNPGTIG